MRLLKIAAIGLVIIAVLSAILWLNRYTLAEYAAQRNLAEQGIDADVSFRSITLSRVIIEDISLSHEGMPFFSAQRMTAEYNWRDVLKKKLERITIESPVMYITVNEAGKLTDDWIPQSQSGGDVTALFPQKGIVITSGRANISSPYGPITASINAEIPSASSLKGDVKINKTQLSAGGFAGDIALNVRGSIDEDIVKTEFDIRSDRWSYQDYKVGSSRVTGTALTPTDAPLGSAQIDARLQLSAASMPDMSIGKADISWMGTVSRPSAQSTTPHANGTWSASINDAKIDNSAQRMRVARSLTLQDTLSGLSSSAPLAPQLLSIAADLLKQSDINAEGTLDTSETGARVRLNEGAIIKTPRNTLSLTPDSGQDFFVHGVQDQSMDFHFSAALSGPKNITLSNARLTAQISDDHTMSTVQTFSALVTTRETWRSETDQGRPVRLAPLKAQVSYDARQPQRVTSMVGAIDFDGDIPGGYAAGLKAEGTLVLKTTPERLLASFTPSRGKSVQIKRGETVTDWIIDDAEFMIAGDGPVYRRTSQSATLSTRINTGTGHIRHRTEAQNMDIAFETADITADIFDDRQNWTIIANKTRLTSETFPSPGTDIASPAATITVSLAPSGSPEFTIISPQTDVKTQLVKAAGLSVKASGTPSDMAVTYGGGQIQFAAGELPVMPLQGEVEYENGRWDGTAETYLPRAQSTPIYVTYAFQNGIGTADVTFDDLTFKPSGLQPKHLVSAFSGKVSRVAGRVSSKIHLSFGANQPLKSSGTAAIRDMNFSTLPGPVSGMNTDLTLSSFFPLETQGVQTLTVKNFDPGFPLENGTAEFEIVPEGLRLHSANWPLGGGQLSLDPTIWRYSAPQNRVVLRADNISLGEFFKNVGGGRLKATGDVNGALPVVIEGVKVNVDNGLLTVKNGGLIQYSTPRTNQAGEANPYAGYAFDALKNFEYQELEAALNGPLDGPMRLKMLFTGSNPEVLDGSEFKFNVGIEGELMNIMRSFKIGQDISDKILQQVQSTRPQP